MKSALVLYPHQLYKAEALPQVHTVFMVEEPLYFGADREYPLKLHKQKLILHRASMRRYVEEVLYPSGVNVEYLELDVLYNTGDILERVRNFDQLYLFDLTNDTLTKRILQARRELSKMVAIEFLPTPNFYLKDHEVRQYFGERHQKPFADFYQWQRERFNVLIGDNYKPVGGKWSFEAPAQKRLAADQVLPSFGVFGSNDFVRDAVKWVEERFPDNPGGTDFIWPTSHSEAAEWLDNFLDQRLDEYAQHQEIVGRRAPWLFHSALASSLNIGLLDPDQIVSAAIARHEKRPAPIESLECFIRQVIGWREFIHGLYVTHGQEVRERNVFRHQRKLTNSWYEGTLGIPPFDEMVVKIHKHAYVHHAERTTIAAGLMLLAEIQPAEIYRWFNEMFIDAYEWDTTTGLYTMLQFTDPTNPVSTPIIAASNYLLQVSDFERGTWADIWDGLFWRFVEKNRASLNRNQKMRTLVTRLDRLDADRKRIISYRADDFLDRYTV